MRKYWMLERSALREYNSLIKKLNVSESLMTEYLNRCESSSDSDGSDGSDDLTIVDGTALILVRGVLNNRIGFFDFMMDRNPRTYKSIARQIGLAESDNTVQKIELRVDSPGGLVDGLFDLLNVIKSTKKPISSLIENRADSAAYGIVSQTDLIIATGKISEVGSIGVATSFFVDDEIVDIASTDAPDKRPDVTTPEGINTVRAELDQIHAQFAEIIAEGRSAATGRSITVEIVNKDFGRGGTMLAPEGLSAGMIDEIQPAPERVSNSQFFQNTGTQTSGSSSSNLNKKIKNKMDLEELKSKHPALYKEIFESGMKAGTTSEGDRITALLKLGKSSGKIDYALECIKDGLSIKQDSVLAEFLSGKINVADQKKRDDDNVGDLNTGGDNNSSLDVQAEVNKLVAERKSMRGA